MADLRTLPTVHQAFKDALAASGNDPKAWTPCPRCGSVKVRHWSRYGSNLRIRLSMLVILLMLIGLLSIFIITLIFVPLVILAAPFLVAFAPKMTNGGFCRECHLHWKRQEIEAYVGRRAPHR